MKLQKWCLHILIILQLYSRHNDVQQIHQNDEILYTFLRGKGKWFFLGILFLPDESAIHFGCLGVVGVILSWVEFHHESEFKKKMLQGLELRTQSRAWSRNHQLNLNLKPAVPCIVEPNPNPNLKLSSYCWSNPNRF